MGLGPMRAPAQAVKEHVPQVRRGHLHTPGGSTYTQGENAHACEETPRLD